jgi:hypothetical protein
MATPAARSQAVPNGAAAPGPEWRSGGRGSAARGRGTTRGAARTTSHGGRQRQGEQRSSQTDTKPAAEQPASTPVQKKSEGSAHPPPLKPSGRQGSTPAAKSTPSAKETTAAKDSTGSSVRVALAGKGSALQSSSSKAPRGRRGSRLGKQIPTLVIDPSSPTTPSLPSNTQHAPPSTAPLPESRTASQRGHRRPRNHNRTASSRSSVSGQDDPVQPPNTAAPSLKQVPPHLAAVPATAAPDIPSFPHKVDNLVDRMRAMATSRASSPGSHHDWAEDDDDDTLPDLDDWFVGSFLNKYVRLRDLSRGYTTTKTAITANETIESDLPEAMSPILQNDLRRLPDLAEAIAVPTAISNPESQQTLPIVAEADQRTSSSMLDSQASGIPSTNSDDAKDVGETQNKASNVAPSEAASTPRVHDESTLSTKPLHPSLPPKPSAITTAATDSAILPPKPDVPVPQHEPQGLNASMHAPIARQPSSAPSHILNYPSHPSVPQRAQHGVGRSRAHHPGRGADHRGPHSPPAASSRPTSAYQPRSAPLANGMHHHNRARSSPANPAGGMGNGRNPLHNRPVITVDAITRLARTLGTKASASPPASKPTPLGSSD